METYKRWLFNGLPLFISMGCVTLKTLWDSWLLETGDSLSFHAFALLFPGIVLINTISVSFANAVTGTVSKWTSEGKAQLKIVSYFAIFSIFLGLMTALLIQSLTGVMIAWFEADKYAAQINIFAETLIWWLPLQYTMVIFAQLARFLGLFQTSSIIQIISAFIGAILSYYLVIHLHWFEPLQNIVYSNAAMALISNASLLILLAGRLAGKSGALEVEVKPLLSRSAELFYTTFASQIIAVAFIFILTQQLSQHGEAVVGLMAYLIRAEQLILLIAGAFTSVMLPDVIRMSKRQDTAGLSAYLRNSDTFLLVVSTSVTLVVSSVLCIKILFWGQLDKTSTSLILITLFWLFGTILQGNIIFYSQVLNVVFSPASAFRLNVIRFVLVGMPLIYLASQVGDGVGVAVGLALISLIFLPLYRKKANDAISEFVQSV